MSIPSFYPLCIWAEMNTVSLKKVISASRRLDMVAFYPEQLNGILSRRCPPDKVHTVVLWSKNPRNMLEDRKLRQTLERYGQLYLHFTITGMGSSSLEPNIPDTETAIGMLDPLVALVNGPERIRVRFDPIVHLLLPDGSSYTNLLCFTRIAEAAKRAGVVDLVVSWMEQYPKVRNRLARNRIASDSVSPEKWREEWDWIFTEANRLNVRVAGCCVQGLPVSRCIDGPLLFGLHPKQEPVSNLKAKGQRPHCGCTESWDIGWYYPCPGGCLYCYARPVEYGTFTND